MENFMRILRDPDPAAPAGGGSVAPAAPAEPQMPKTKEDWEKLAQDNPQQWIKWTQPRMDQAVREARENKEKFAAEEQKRKNLEVELENFRKGKKPEPAPEIPDPEKPFSRGNMPVTETQWDQLWLENPNLAADLRHFKNEQDKTIQDRQVQVRQTFVKARQECVKTLAERHPDMYVPEKDDQGNIKMDGNGKPVLKISPETGLPIPDLESSKFKVFNEVYIEDSEGYDATKNGPRLAMVEMERRLRERGEQQIKDGQSGQSSGAPAPDQRGVLPGGVLPPVTGKVTFTSDEEKIHATKAVERGIYKNLEEYCQLRDGKSTGFMEENRTPKFG